MVRLHGGDDAELGEARDVGRAQVLGVLDPEPPVAGAVLLLDALVDVEQLRVRAVADRVDLDLEPGFVRARDVFLDLRKRDGLGGEDAPVAGLVAEGFEHHGGAGSEGAVHVALDAADAEPVVVLDRGLELFRLRPVRKGRAVVDAHRHFPRVAQGGPGGHVGRSAGEVLHGGHAEFRDVLHRGPERGRHFRRGAGRTLVPDEFHRAVLQDAGRLALRVAHDDAARRIRRGCGHSRDLHREAVADHHVAVLARQARRVVAGGRIEKRPGRQDRRRPPFFVPDAVGQPLPRRACLRVRGQQARELGAVLRMPHVQGQQVEAAARHVRMAVDEPGHDAAPLAVDHDRLGALELADVTVHADRDDPPVPHGKRFRLRVLRVSGPDLRRKQNEVRRRFRGRRREQDRHGQRRQHAFSYAVEEVPTCFSLRDALAAARRATGTRNGEQDT